MIYIYIPFCHPRKDLFLLVKAAKMTKETSVWLV